MRKACRAEASPVVTAASASDGSDPHATPAGSVDAAGLICLTDVGRGSTCGACAANVA